jgi:hypothetical protein
MANVPPREMHQPNSEMCSAAKSRTQELFPTPSSPANSPANRVPDTPRTLSSRHSRRNRRKVNANGGVCRSTRKVPPGTSGEIVPGDFFNENTPTAGLGTMIGQATQPYKNQWLATFVPCSRRSSPYNVQDEFVGGLDEEQLACVGGSLKSKPMWSNASCIPPRRLSCFRCFGISAMTRGEPTAFLPAGIK